MSTSYTTLSSVYFFYFAVLGATNPYWGLYLQSLGFSADEIGSLMAVFIATKLIAPNSWSFLADKTGQHHRVMQLGAILTPVSFTLIWFQQGFWTMTLAMMIYSFFWNAVLPQYEVITLRSIKGQEERYSQIRLWGSVGFIIAVAGLGWWLDFSSIDTLPGWILLIMIFMALVSFALPSEKPMLTEASPSSTNRKTLGQILKQPHVIIFFIAVMLMQMSHGPYYTFFSIFMEQHGYNRTVIGLLWALGVFAEVCLFLIMHRLLKRLGAEIILLVSLILAVVRWGLTGFFPDSFIMILLLQCLHAATFGCFHAACIALVHRFFPETHSGQGQALYSSAGFGIGGAIGAWGSGLIWQNFSPVTCFVIASVTVGIAAIMVSVSVSRHRHHWLPAK